MKRLLRLATAALLCIASTGTLKAGFTNYDFNTDPTAFFDGTTNSFILAASASRNIFNPGAPAWTNGPAGAQNYFWQPSGGFGGIADGFMSIVDAVGNEGLVCAFPYLDFITNLDSSITPTPLRAFKIEMDLRVGNSTNADARAADGFSISFARANDLVISNALPQFLGGGGTLAGFAGGDSLAVAQAASPGSGDAENGTKTGVSVVFDSWEGNWLPDTPIRASGQSNDREGIAVRVDDSTLIQVSLTNRNGLCTNLAPHTSACNATACADVNSLQTGGWSPDAANNSYSTGGAYTNLCWQHLSVELNISNRLTVIWKGRTVISTNLPAWSPTAGRLILAGRTGGNCQNVHVDNIQITTVPTTNSYLAGVHGNTQGFDFDVEDFGQDHVTNITQVLLDATNDLTSLTTISNFPPGHFGFYSQVLPFPSGSKHTVAVTWQTDLGFTISGTNLFSVPVYTALATNLAVPLSAIDTSKPGFRLNAYQSFANNPASLRWTEEMIIGLHGTNVIGAPTVPTEGGFQVWDGPLDFENVNGPQPGPGIFPYNFDMAQFGIGANYPADVLHAAYDNCALELYAYAYFPTSGIYTFIFGSDDSVQVTVGSNPLDRMGTVLFSLNGNRLPSATSLPVAADLQNFYVAQPGCYPLRILYENGTGNAGLEWYSYNFSAASGIIVNDTNTPGALLTYRAPLTYQPGPYVIKADPVRDSQQTVYYQPIVVDLGDGAGSKTVNTGTIALSVDGNAQGLTISHVGATTHIVQQLTNSWSSGAHTNVLTFQDNLGTNYTYTWPFTVIGGVNGVAAADRTNTAIVQVPLSAMVPFGSLSQPGFRIRSHQMYFKNFPANGTTEEQLEGLHGPNIADQSQTNGPGFFVWTNFIDFRKVTGAGNAAANAAGEFSQDLSLNAFGFNTLQQNNSLNNVDNSALEIDAYLYFPSAGNYIVHANTDDNFKLIVPTGLNPLGKLGTVLGAFDAGRGMVAAAGGVQTGGTFFQINIPAAGAYPFRMIWANGGGDCGTELSIYQALPDGSVGKIPINDTGTAGSILAYQVSSAATGPYVSFVNPVPDKRDAVFYQPIVVDLTDGTTTTDPSRIDALTVDGLPFGFSASKSGNVTHIVGNPSTPWLPSTAHTNVLSYHDSASVSYSNTWAWVCTNFSPFGIITIPSSYAVPLSSLDQNQPGFRIKSYQTTAGNPNTIAWTEEMFEGLHGPNIADLSGAVNSNYFTYNGVIEFNNNGTGGANAGNGEWEYDYPLGPGSGSGGGFGHQYQPSFAQMNNDALDIATYLYFPRSGTYMMELATDDDFRLTVPYGNPFNKFGIYVSSVEGGHGTAGAGYGPTGRAIVYSFLNIPTAGAYPFRLLWENAGGGASVEWNVWEYLTNDAVAQVLVGDTNTPGIIKAFQTSTNDTPYVISLFPIPGNVYGQAPAITLAPPPYSVNPFSGATNDVIIQLQDANTTVNGGSVTLSLNGISQPITVSQAGGITTVVRSNSVAPYWPSGQYGQLILTFTDSAGRNITMPLAYVATPFWGTLTEGFPTGVGDPARRGFYLRTYQPDQTGSTVAATRAHVAEQVLAGVWTNNMANLASATASLPPPTNKYFVLAGTGGTAGVINFNPAKGTGADIGDFQSPTNADQLLPGLPGTGTTNNRTNSFFAEFLTYVEFPTNGTYVLGVNSDDGFRLTRGWGAANNNGALIVNSPANVAGAKATAQNTFLTSLSITSPITGNLVLAQGPFGGANPFGSTNYNGLGYSVDGCLINNGPALAGNIALMYRSVSCSFVQQVQNAAAAGARAVVFVQNRPASEGWFPTEAGVTPVQSIPAVMIKLDDGLKLIAAMAANTVNVTLTPMDYLINPPASESPLGQADVGKGASDVLFPVVVPTAGTYPLRLVWQQGGGGANCEFFSVVGNNRVLINDDTNPNGPALKAYYGLNVSPSLGLNYNGSIITVTNTGTLQKLADLNTTNWVDIYNDVPVSAPATNAQQFFRAR